MHFVTCVLCEAEKIVFDMDRMGFGYRCRRACTPDASPLLPLQPVIDPPPLPPAPAVSPTPDFEPLKAGLRDATQSVKELVDTLADLATEYGFTGPEDGSEARYHERRTRMTSARHAFWWLVHNNIAHPLIGLMPKRFAFNFHDWTSRKLHGL